ncbi:sugar phosphate isomerase/epimerase family protein [Flavobacterium sp.]|uniref:sugar phosphate isomerase/epimerase family protein n=1 Tax=Flavobacterium sp. TaxID=239 RepID=UPI002632372B|nr:sugar phosphate isomerase/epimerase family protein [Flavobacterium sp.]
MKLAISNIAWDEAIDSFFYTYLQKIGFDSIEIAPTRLFGNAPYSELSQARTFKQRLWEENQLTVCSLQSILFGRTESIFDNPDDRKAISNYCKEAILFASAISCPNLVFGSPKNRIIKDGQYSLAQSFFKELGDFAHVHNTNLALEPNPTIYGTNFINTTREAIDFVGELNCPGLKINFDLGAFIHNKEDISVLEDAVHLINHVHISEPYLEMIVERPVHKKLLKFLSAKGYENFISIEMKRAENVSDIQKVCEYIKNCRDGI